MAILTDDFLLDLIQRAREEFSRRGYFELTRSQLESLWENEGHREGRLGRIRLFANACGARVEVGQAMESARLTPKSGEEGSGEPSAEERTILRPARRATTRSW